MSEAQKIPILKLIELVKSCHHVGIPILDCRLAHDWCVREFGHSPYNLDGEFKTGANKKMIMGDATPCEGCMKVLVSFGIKNVFYTDHDGTVQHLEIKEESE